MGQNVTDRVQNILATDRLSLGKDGEIYQETTNGRLARASGTLEVEAGSGIADYANVYRSSIWRSGGLVQTQIYIDLTGLYHETITTIIGGENQPNCHLGQIDHSITGEIVGGFIQCLDTPSGGDKKIDFYWALSPDGAQNQPIGQLPGYQIFFTKSTDWVWGFQQGSIVNAVTDGAYFYAVSDGADPAAEYTNGLFMLQLYGIV